MISYAQMNALVFHDTDPELLSERELFEVAQRIGSLTLKSKRVFIGLLPLIERRRAYEGRGFYSLYDFAAKVGGVSREVVTEVLRIDKYLSDTPKLRRKFYNGEIGWTKISRVIHWVTRSTENEWIQKLELLSKGALEVYLRDMQKQVDVIAGPQQLWSAVAPVVSGGPMAPEVLDSMGESRNISEIPVKFEAESLPGQGLRYDNSIGIWQDDPLLTRRSNYGDDVHVGHSKLSDLAMQRETFTFSMNRETAARLRLFRQQLEKNRRELITWEEVMVEFLRMIEGEERNRRESGGKKMQKMQKMQKMHGEYNEQNEKGDQNAYIEQGGQKEQNERGRQNEQKLPIGTVIHERIAPTDGAASSPAVRYIPAAVRHAVDAQYEGLCAFGDCALPATSYHHTRRYALTKDLPAQQVHDPRHLKPLCKAHERVVHTTLVKDEDGAPASHWKLLEAPDSASPRYQIDQQVAKFRKPK